MKITDHCIVVLTEDGQFRNIPHRSIMPELGEQIEIEHQEQARRATNWYRSKIVAAVASLLIIIVTVLLSSHLTSSSVTTAVVAIDINPSIELSVNNEGIVSQVELINDDAKWLLSANDLVGKEIYSALAYVLQQAETQGYLNRTDKSDVWLTGVYLTEDANRIDFDKLTQNYPQYEFHRLDGDADKLKQAKQVQLSLNKFLVYKMMQDRGIELELEELRSQPVGAVLQTHREEEPTDKQDKQDKHDPITIDEVQQPEVKVESGAASVKEQQEAIVDEREEKEEGKEKDRINQQSEHQNSSKDTNDKRKGHREDDEDDDEDEDDEIDADKDQDHEDEHERKSEPENNPGHKSNHKQYDADKEEEGDGKKFDKHDRDRKDVLPKDKKD